MFRSLIMITVAAATLGAQDTTRTRQDSVRLDTLERVVIRATRGRSTPPTSQTMLTRRATCGVICQQILAVHHCLAFIVPAASHRSLPLSRV